MTMELALLRAARPELDPSNAALMQRLERLERSMGGERAQAPPPPKPSKKQPSAERAPAVAAEPAATGESAENKEAEDAQEAEEGPVAQAAAAAATMDLERLVEVWPAVLDQVRHSGSELLSTVFAAARPVAVDIESAVLQVGFPPSAAFNKRKAEAQEARERFTEAVRTIVGERLKPVYVLLEGEPEEAASPEESLSDEELLERLKSEFDAEEVLGEGDEQKTDEEEAA
jgi:DNA polymerase-3 subunit gamma/tau